MLENEWLENAEDKKYIQPYGELDVQMNMIRDEPRTLTYFEAIKHSASVFENMKVMDVGSGSGVLSFFSCQAGAAKVYAVEASCAMRILKALVEANPQYKDRIVPVYAMLENIEVAGADEPPLTGTPIDEIVYDVSCSPHHYKVEQVDIIVSEPMGICLLFEGMMDTLLVARDRFLRRKPDGSLPSWSMFPNRATIHVGLSTSTYFAKYVAHETALWRRKNYFGVDWRAMHKDAVAEILGRPLILNATRMLDNPLYCEDSSSTDDSVQRCEHCQHILNLPEASGSHVSGSISFDLLTCSAADFVSPAVTFTVGPLPRDEIITAFVVWFDVEFYGNFKLTTDPSEEPTHWHQTAFILEQPAILELGATLTAEFKMIKLMRTYQCAGALYKDDICIAKTRTCFLHVSQLAPRSVSPL